MYIKLNVMLRIFVILFCYVFTLNASEYIVSISNMCGENINLCFSDGDYKLSYAGPYDKDATFFPIDKNNPIEIDLGVEIYVKVAGETQRNVNKCTFWFDNYPEMKFDLMPSWYQMLGDGPHVDRFHVSRWRRKNSPVKCDIIIAKYTESDSDEGVSFKRIMTIEVKRHPRKYACCIQ